MIAPCRVIRSPAAIGRGSPENVFSFSPGLPDRTGRGIDISSIERRPIVVHRRQDVWLPAPVSRSRLMSKRPPGARSPHSGAVASPKSAGGHRQRQCQQHHGKDRDARPFRPAPRHAAGGTQDAGPHVHEKRIERSRLRRRRVATTSHPARSDRMRSEITRGRHADSG